MSYKLYTYFRSSTAWRVRIALNLKKVVPQYQYVHLFKGNQKSQQYKKINPNQGVPSLVLPNGKILIQSMAIIQYLDEVQTKGIKYFPNDPIQKAQIRGFCEVINSGIHPYQNLRLLQKLQFQHKIDRSVFAKYWVTRGMDTIQKMAQKTRGKYVFGDKITAADIFFYPQVIAATTRFGANIKDYRNSEQILNNLKKIQQFVQAQPQNQGDYEK